MSAFQEIDQLRIPFSIVFIHFSMNSQFQWTIETYPKLLRSQTLNPKVLRFRKFLSA